MGIKGLGAELRLEPTERRTNTLLVLVFSQDFLTVT